MADRAQREPVPEPPPMPAAPPRALRLVISLALAEASATALFAAVALVSPRPPEGTTATSVRIFAAVFLVLAVVRGVALYLTQRRRDPRLRWVSIGLLVLTAVAPTFGIISTAVAVVAIYFLQFHRETKAWFAAGETSGTDPQD